MADGEAKGMEPTASTNAPSWAEVMEMVKTLGSSDYREAGAEAAFATRRIINSLVRTKIPVERLSELASELESIATQMEEFTSYHGWEGFSEAANSGDSNLFFDRSPLIGIRNPLAPPLLLRPMKDDDGSVSVVGEGTFGYAYEGPPGCVHGGYIAASFDEVCGMAQSLSGSPGMTAYLHVNYRKPTPLHRRLRFEGRLVRRDGRKIFTTGACFDGEVLTAEAEALFISVDFQRLAALMLPPH